MEKRGKIHSGIPNSYTTMEQLHRFFSTLYSFSGMNVYDILPAPCNCIVAIGAMCWVHQSIWVGLVLSPFLCRSRAQSENKCLGFSQENIPEICGTRTWFALMAKNEMRKYFLLAWIIAFKSPRLNQHRLTSISSNHAKRKIVNLYPENIQ